jgi:peptidoglycan-associated lipoprotein
MSVTGFSSTPILRSSRADAAATLDRQAQWLNQYPTYQITMEGHADERGTREYNLALGARRAAAARQYLSSRGVAANRINTISFGKERPVAVCDDISCWSQNRRAVTVLAAPEADRRIRALNAHRGGLQGRPFCVWAAFQRT